MARTATQRLPLGGEAVGLVPIDEARNPPLPVADTGGCSANEATSFASVSVAKRPCRIVRVVAAAAALPFINRFDNGYFVAYTSSERLKPPTFSSRRRLLVGCILQEIQIVAFPLIRFAMLSTFPLPGEGFYCPAFSSGLTDLTDYRNQPCLIPAPNHAPVAR